MNEITLPHDHGGQNHEALVSEMRHGEKFEAVAELFRQMSDPVRVRIFWLLSHREECVINISAMLGMSSPAVSHHLRQLKDCGIIESRRDGKEVYYRIADGEKCILLHEVIEQIMEISCPSDTAGATQKETVKKVHDYLLEHLSERITIEELSQIFHVNPTTLKQNFKDYYGSSVAAHINEHRMEKAARLLAESEKSVSEIAAEVGFSSQSRFGDAFKTHFGLLPTEYRAKNNGIQIRGQSD